jgi:hypothetical protein
MRSATTVPYDQHPPSLSSSKDAFAPIGLPAQRVVRVSDRLLPSVAACDRRGYRGWNAIPPT